MELYAVGQNGWAQLEFGARQHSRDDVSELIKVATGTTIEKPISGLAYTLVRVDNRFLVAGKLSHNLIARVAVSVANANADSLCATENGKCLLLVTNKAKPKTTTISLQPRVKQMAALDTGFVILHEGGIVATMGDARFPAILGRQVTQDAPAGQFAMLDDLVQLQDPVKHITARGYAAAALTQSGSVYIWGQHPPSRRGQQPFFPNLSSIPNYTEIGGGKDIQDVALGETHGIALTCEGELYVIGNNESGQLGIPALESTDEWTKLAFYPPHGSLVTAVAAGPHTSFILASANPAH